MKLLLIGDERKNRRMFAWGFSADPYEVKMASTRAEIDALVRSDSFHAACVDLKMQESDATLVVEHLHRTLPRLPIIALVGDKERKRADDLRERGVVAHLGTPFPIEQLHEALQTHALREAVGAERSGEARDSTAPSASATPFLVNDPTARRTLDLALRAANSSAAILVLGETGTGKTALAQAIHQHSPIREKPFVTVNCPCLSHELLESELFGHVRGAFTGAVQDTWGKVAAAEGGTLFLDEIGDLPMALQPKLLRLLQEKQYERIGEPISRSANVRIIAATNRDLKREVAAGCFREDLYYRLNVIAIDVPPLRNRPEQIMAQAEAFLDFVCRQLGRMSPGFSASARRILENYPWPGNLRELRNVVERAAILSSGGILDAEDFPALIAETPASRFQVGAAISLRALEDAHIRMVVANSASLEEAARILEIDKSTLYRRRKQMDSGAGSGDGASLARLAVAHGR